MKPATLLARKCLLHPQTDEVQALLSLVETGNLNVEWFEPLENGQSLLETGLKHIKEFRLLEKLYELVDKVSPLNPMTPLSSSDHSTVFAHVLFGEPQLWPLGERVLKRNHLSDQQWEDLLQTPQFQVMLLSPNFNEWKNHFSSVTQHQWQKLEQYRKDHLWMHMNTMSDFVQHCPADLSSSQLLTWAKFSLPLIKSNAAMWRLGALTSKQKLWNQWSDDEWMSVWESQPVAGFLLGKTRDYSIKHGLQFVKKYTPQPSPRSLYILGKELNALAKTHQELKGTYSGNTRYDILQSEVKSSSRVLKEWADRIFPSQGSPFTQGLFLGFLQMSQSSVKFDQNAIKAWETAPPIPHIDDFVEKIRQALPPGHNQNTSFWLQTDLLAYFIQQYLLSQQNQSSLSSFVKSLDVSAILPSTVPHDKREALALKLVQLSTRLAQDITTPSLLQKAAAEIFWRNVFTIAPANQHYWLKKASGMSPLSQKLDFWSASFQSKLEEANSQRKKTKEITALLTKLSLNNILDIEKAPTSTKPRKM